MKFVKQMFSCCAWAILFCGCLMTMKLEADCCPPAVEGNWSLPVNVDQGGAFPGPAGLSHPKVGVDSHGNAVAVWWEASGSKYVVSAATLPLGGTWSQPIAISLTGDGPAFFDMTLGLSVAPNGNAVAIWPLRNGSTQEVQTAQYDVASGTWTPPTTLSTVGDLASLPTIAIGKNGRAVAVWGEVLSSVYTLRGATLDPLTNSWVSTSDIGFNPSQDSVAVDDEGNAVVVWQDSSVGQIMAATLANGALTWTSAVPISVAVATTPLVAYDSQGNAVAVWLYGPSNDVIQSATLPKGGSWSAPITLTVGTLPDWISLAVDKLGNATVVYSVDIANVFSVYGTTIPYNGTWQSPVLLEGGMQTTPTPSVAVDCEGNAYAVWSSEVSDNSAIHSSILSLNGCWSSFVTISDPAYYTDRAFIDVSPCGNAVSVWLKEPSEEGQNATLQSASWDGVPCKPRKFHANVYRHHHEDYYWRLHAWFTPPREFGDIAFYEIYQEGKPSPIAIVDADDEHKFKKFIYTSYKLSERYSLVAVSQNYLRSDPVPLELNRRYGHND